MVEKISFALYDLVPVKKLNAVTFSKTRTGALLKVSDSRMGSGFADLHPWPEWGDLPLMEQLKRLKTEPTNLGNISLEYARRDALARSSGVSLLEGYRELKNNYLITDPENFKFEDLANVKKQGFDTLKIKAGRDLDQEKNFVQKISSQGQFKWRLDFNSSLHWDQFQKFFEGWKPVGAEYAEDPFPYDPNLWKEGRRLVPLALDFEAEKISWASSERPCCDFLVLKPARLPMEEVEVALEKWKLPFVVTSSMDHPVGILHAVSWASHLKRKFGALSRDNGLLTTSLYLEDDFSSSIKSNGPRLALEEQEGIGLNKAFNNVEWLPL